MLGWAWRGWASVPVCIRCSVGKDYNGFGKERIGRFVDGGSCAWDGDATQPKLCPAKLGIRTRLHPL